MASHDYFNPSSSNFDQRFNESNPPPPPPSSTKPTPIYTSPGPPSPSPYEGYSGRQRNRESQNTLFSEPDYYSGSHGGRANASDQYADDIPLKSSTQQTGQAHWMNENTQYPPSPESQRHPQLEDPSMHRSRKGKFFKKKIPWVVYINTLAQVIVFIIELVRNAQLTGSPIMTKPSFNPFIGPSPYVQINMGARYIPCMRSIPGVQNASVPIDWFCPSSTSDDPDDPNNKCTLSQLCGINGVPNPVPNGSIDDKPQPNQWFRFIIPMFLHGGVIHIGMNMLVQIFMGGDMERTIGWWRFAFVYYASGIFGFVLGGNFAGTGITSTGASGSLFGVFALALLDLLYTWGERPSPGKELIFMIIGVVVSFVLGLLPGLDNFSHIGGFLMGLVLGVCILRSPNALRERIGLERMPYLAMSGGTGPAGSETTKTFIKEPLGFFKGRKPLWWVWWAVRAAALIGIIVAFIVLINEFYRVRSTCSWCKYLSCLPVNGWCEIGNLEVTEH
ncbi:hypothetical protein FQN54_007985 [Arachnomyces sp. PD_36]|nr:hypothetical protein FQN54_007985 [Arachnomyces sp. PD_36]